MKIDQNHDAPVSLCCLNVYDVLKYILYINNICIYNMCISICNT